VIVRACVASCALIALAGCGGDERVAAPEPEAPPRAVLASGEPLPARCVPGPVRPKATATFVANGHVWALEPGSGRVTCLFSADDPGPFLWGPRADRALLARLEVKGLAGAPSRAPAAVDPSAASWGRPVGKSIVFVGRGGRALLKARPGGGGFLDVTPVRGARYERVVYHPSGLAFAFVLRRSGRESVWISSNTGKKPKQLVHGRFHTDFGPIAFGDGGWTLYFSALHAGGHVDVHSLSLAAGTSAPVRWRGKPGERVFDLRPGPFYIAITVGRSCASRRVIEVDRPGVDVMSGMRPARAIGWLGDFRLLAAVGGCGRPIDLYSVRPDTGNALLLVRNVDAASVRRAERLPPPPFPSEQAARSSFA
jgi:hypothetical protein